MQWKFSTKRPSDKTRDPVVGEFFSSDAIKDAGEALVREAIQNSLDARDVGSIGPVRVRIFVSGSGRALSPEVHSRWFGDAWPHYQSTGNGLRPGDLNRTSTCRYLSFEDFGTTGLTGDREQYEEVAAAKNPFFYFFRAEAKTAKYGDDRGRWGIGKQVFPRASRAQTFFGYTETDDGGFLMGGCILKHHFVDGVCYKPDGFWGEPKEVLSDTLIVPTSQPATLDAFRRDFNLMRAPGQHGLSVVVPWLDDAEDDSRNTRAFDRNALALAVLEGYFVPVIEGRLEATVEDQAGALHLSQSTYREVLDLVKATADPKRLKDLERLESRLALAEDVRLGRLRRFELPPCSVAKAIWDDSMLPASVASEMRESLASGDVIAVTAHLTVRSKTGSPKVDTFQCYIKKAPDQAGRPCHIREDLIIAAVESAKVTGHVCLVRVDRGPLATLLGDAESPAHTEWQPSSRNFKDKYVYGGLTIEFVSQFPSELLRRVYATSRQLDRSLLMDLFNDPGPEKPLEQPTRRHKPDVEDDVPVDFPPPKAARYRISQTGSGFTVSSTASALTKGTEMTVMAAYETSKGNPFKAYNKNDFDLKESPIEVVAAGCRVLKVQENLVTFAVEEPEFSVNVTGFDINRDLVVRASIHESAVAMESEESVAGA